MRTRASTSTRRRPRSPARRRRSGPRSRPACSETSADSGASSVPISRPTATPSWSRPPTASARSSRSQSRWAATTPAGPTWSTTASTTSWSRGRGRCSSSTTSRPAKVDPAVIESIIDGVARACRENGTALLGGETAEMPGFYAAEEYDIAGTIVGVVDREKILDGSRIAEGDLALGLPSLGLQTNGYTLARKVFFETMGLSPRDKVRELGGARRGRRPPGSPPLVLEAPDAASRRRPGARDGAPDRRRLLRQHPARAAGGSGRRHQGRRVARPAGVRRDRARRRRRVRGDAPRLQHGYRDDRLRRGRRTWGRSPRSGATPTCRGTRWATSRARAPAAWSSSR